MEGINLMAIIHGLVSVAFTDALGVPATTSVNFVGDSTDTAADMITAANQIATLLNGISDDAITSVSIVIGTGATHAITAGAETNEGVNIAMETSAPNRDWSLWVPALKDSLIVSGKINIASGAIFNLAAELVTPTGVLTWETPYLNAYTALESAAEAFRKLRGLTSKKTKSSNPV